MKRSSVPKGRDSHRLLAHGHLAVAHADAVDAVGRALVREAGARNQLVGGGEIAQDLEVLGGGPRRQRAESPASAKARTGTMMSVWV